MPRLPVVEGRFASRLMASLQALAIPAAIAAIACQPALAQDASPRRGIMAPPAATPAEPSPAARAPLDPAWIGAWMGTARMLGAEGAALMELPVVAVVRSPEAGPEAGPIVELWSLPAGALGKAAIDVVANGRSLAFTLESQGESVRFEATLAEGDASVSGQMRMSDRGRRDAAPQANFTLKRIDIVSEVADSRVFAATLEVGTQKLPMRLALGDQILGELALSEQGIGGDVLALDVEGIEQRDGDLDLIGLLGGLGIALYGQGTDFFGV